MNTAAIYDSAMAGLQYAQAGMVATSQNVTGANVAGYVRRNPNLQISSLSPSSLEIGGTAFSVEGFTRSFNALLQGQVWSQQSKTSYTATLTQSVSTLDSMLVDPSASIATALGNFFNAAGSLANDPSNQSYQQALTGAAMQVGDRIRGLAKLVNSLETNARQGLADVLNQANALAPQLADINARINGASTPGVSYPSGDLLDERDRIASQLQQLVGGITVINEDGTASVQFNGMQLVDRQLANQFCDANGVTLLSAGTELKDIMLKVKSPRNAAPQLVRLGTNQQIDINSQAVKPMTTSFNEGQAGAYDLLIQNFVPTLEKSLNLLTMQLVNKTNAITNESGNPIQPIFGFQSTVTGDKPYFTDLSQVLDARGNSIKSVLGDKTFEELMDMSNPSSSQYSVELDEILHNFNLRSGVSIEAGLFSGVASTATNQFLNFTATAAGKIEGLRTVFSAPVTFITSSVANTISTWTSKHKTNEAMNQVLIDQKNAVSGVNLDEEAANLVKYQQLYNAASKLIQTNRQMFDTLLAMLSGN